MPTPCPSSCHLPLHTSHSPPRAMPMSTPSPSLPLRMTMPCHPCAFVHPCPHHSCLFLCHSNAHGTSFPIPMPSLCHAHAHLQEWRGPFCDSSICMPSQSPPHTQTHVIPAPVPPHHPNSFAHPMFISISTIPSPCHALKSLHPHTAATALPPACPRHLLPCACATLCPCCAHTSTPAPRSR